VGVRFSKATRAKSGKGALSGTMVLHRRPMSVQESPNMAMTLDIYTYICMYVYVGTFEQVGCDSWVYALPLVNNRLTIYW
jgi:hypothetical protein